MTGADPIKTGLVDSFSRPGGNLTGMFILVSMLGPKRLELLRELLPSTTTIALLVNSSNPNAVDAPETEAAANAIGRRLEVLACLVGRRRSISAPCESPIPMDRYWPGR
jgi:putative ABC transport system substrate-binding protein